MYRKNLSDEKEKERLLFRVIAPTWQACAPLSMRNLYKCIFFDAHRAIAVPYDKRVWDAPVRERQYFPLSVLVPRCANLLPRMLMQIILPAAEGSQSSRETTCFFSFNGAVCRVSNSLNNDDEEYNVCPSSGEIVYGCGLYEGENIFYANIPGSEHDRMRGVALTWACENAQHVKLYHIQEQKCGMYKRLFGVLDVTPSVVVESSASLEHRFAHFEAVSSAPCVPAALEENNAHVYSDPMLYKIVGESSRKRSAPSDPMALAAEL